MKKQYVTPSCEELYLSPLSLLETSSVDNHEAFFWEFDDVDNSWGS